MLTRDKGGIEIETKVPNTVDVAVSMHPKLLTRINKHLGRLGERNRSGWIRAAIISKMNEEIEALRDPDDVVY